MSSEFGVATHAPVMVSSTSDHRDHLGQMSVERSTQGRLHATRVVVVSLTRMVLQTCHPQGVALRCAGL